MPRCSIWWSYGSWRDARFHIACKFSITYPGIGHLLFSSGCALMNLLSELSYPLSAHLLSLPDLQMKEKHKQANEQMFKYLSMSVGVLQWRCKMAYGSISNQSADDYLRSLSSPESTYLLDRLIDGCLRRKERIRNDQGQELDVLYEHKVMGKHSKERERQRWTEKHPWCFRESLPEIFITRRKAMTLAGDLYILGTREREIATETRAYNIVYCSWKTWDHALPSKESGLMHYTEQNNWQTRHFKTMQSMNAHLHEKVFGNACKMSCTHRDAFPSKGGGGSLQGPRITCF